MPLLPEIVVEDYSLEAAKKFAYSKFENLKENFPEGKGMTTIQSIFDVLEVGVECGYKFASKNNKIVVEDDVEKLINKQLSEFKHDLIESTSTYTKQNCEGAIFGLNRLKESYKAANKTYSEDDLRKAYQQGIEDGSNNCYYEDSFIQSLKQSKTHKWFVAETKQRFQTDVTKRVNPKNGIYYEFKTKVVNDKTYLIGIYSYD